MPATLWFDEVMIDAKRLANEAIIETLNECLIELYISKEQHQELAERLKIK